MNRFEVADDGTIFSIKDDGTIRRIGKINSNGNIEKIDSENSNGLLWFFLIVGVITVIILGILLSNANSELSNNNSIQNNLKYEIVELKNQNNNIKSEYASKIKDLEANFFSISSTFPFKIDRIEIGNEGTAMIDDFGSTLYSYRMRYLKPKIFYTGFVNGKPVTINYKIINPDGTLNYNSSYSTTFSGDGTSMTIFSGNNSTILKGWGNLTSSVYSSGTYRIEIWYNGICFASKYFTMY